MRVVDRLLFDNKMAESGAGSLATVIDCCHIQKDKSVLSSTKSTGEFQEQLLQETKARQWVEGFAALEAAESDSTNNVPERSAPLTCFPLVAEGEFRSAWAVLFPHPPFLPEVPEALLRVVTPPYGGPNAWLDMLILSWLAMLLRPTRIPRTGKKQPGIGEQALENSEAFWRALWPVFSLTSSPLLHPHPSSHRSSSFVHLISYSGSLLQRATFILGELKGTDCPSRLLGS